MKTKYLLFAFPAMLLAACSGEESAPGTAGGAAVVTADIGMSTSRASGMRWDAGDCIGISGTTGSVDYANVPYITEDGNGNFASLDGVSAGIFLQDSRIATFSAYYPYNADVTADNTIITASTADQTQAETFDFLYASGASGSLNEPALNFTGKAAFSHSMAQMVINLSADRDGGFSGGISDVAANGRLTLGGIVHEGEFDTATGIATVSGYAVDFTLSDADVNGNTAGYSLILFPQAADNVELIIEYEGSFYRCILTPTLAAGKRYTANITLRKTGLTVANAEIADWEEGDSFTGDLTIPDPIPPIMVAGHEAVMMRKASGTPGTDDYVPALYFASCNIGAEHPEDAGKYFWFGDVTGYYAGTSFNFDSNNAAIVTNDKDTDKLQELGIIDNNLILTPKNDAASVQWGSGWRMPTGVDFDWLVDSSYCKWDDYEVQTENGAVKGYLVTSKQTRNSIFLPKGGRRLSWIGNSSGPLAELGDNLYLWTSKFLSKNWCIRLQNQTVVTTMVFYGLPIRPVYEQ